MLQLVLYKLYPPGPVVLPTGMDDEEDCQISLAGYYAIEASVNMTGACSAGYYCEAGSTGPQQVRGGLQLGRYAFVLFSGGDTGPGPCTCFEHTREHIVVQAKILYKGPWAGSTKWAGGPLALATVNQRSLTCQQNKIVAHVQRRKG